MPSTILVDAREFRGGRLTGIGRVVAGLVDAIEDSGIAERIMLALSEDGELPPLLLGRSRIEKICLPPRFPWTEKRLAELARHADVFISPFPKLPIWKCHCPTIITVHDVLYLTHESYRRRTRGFYDRWRLVNALRRSDLTWFVSRSSRMETVKLVGFDGNCPKVRHSGIDAVFDSRPDSRDRDVLAGLDLHPGYIVVMGNGKPHKNLGIILKCSERLEREIVFAGVPEENRVYWRENETGSRVRWIRYIPDDALPALLRQAFCLAQPSTVEGYGFPPLEAMACGTPAVISDIPVLAETTGGHALKADPFSPDDWVRAFVKLEQADVYRERVKSGLAWTAPLKGRPAWNAHIGDIKTILGSSLSR